MSSFKNNKHTDIFTENYSENDNYMKVLYNPGKALQANELHNMQTYNTNQIAIQSDMLYKSGSIVTTNYINFSNKYYLLETTEDYSNSDINGKTYIHDNIAIKCIYAYVFNGKYYIAFSNLSDLFTISEEIVFTNSENSEDTITAIGVYRGLLITNTDDGYIYNAGYYLRVQKSEKPILIDIFDNNISIISGSDYKDITYYFGFKITEKYVSSYEDDNLIDYISTTDNYKAPGNNRLQYVTELTGYTEEPTENFVTVLVVKNDAIIKENKAGISGDLLDYLAERTYEESGSYTINPWKVNCTESETDSTKYDINVEPGKGYIYGKKVETLVSTPVENTKNTYGKLYQKERLHVDTLGDYFYARFEDQPTHIKHVGTVNIQYNCHRTYTYNTTKSTAETGSSRKDGTKNYIITETTTKVTNIDYISVYFTPSSGNNSSIIVMNGEGTDTETVKYFNNQLGIWYTYTPSTDGSTALGSTSIYIPNYCGTYTSATVKQYTKSDTYKYRYYDKYYKNGYYTTTSLNYAILRNDYTICEEIQTILVGTNTAALSDKTTGSSGPFQLDWRDSKELYLTASKMFDLNALEGDYLFSFQQFEPVRVLTRSIENFGENPDDLDIIKAEILPPEHKNLLKAAYYKEHEKTIGTLANYDSTMNKYLNNAGIEKTSWDSVISTLQNKIFNKYVKTCDTISPELVAEYNNVNLKWNEYTFRDIRPVIFDVSRLQRIYKIYLLNTGYLRNNYSTAKSIASISELKGINLYNDPMPVYYQGSDTLIVQSANSYVCNDDSNKIKGIFTHQYEAVAKDHTIKIYIAFNDIHVRFLKYINSVYQNKLWESDECIYSTKNGELEPADIIFIDGFGNTYPAVYKKTTLEDPDLDNDLIVIHIFCPAKENIDLDQNNTDKYLSIDNCTISVDYDGKGAFLAIRSPDLLDDYKYVTALRFIDTLDTTKKTLSTKTIITKVSDFIVLDDCDIHSIDKVVINGEIIDSEKYLFDNGQRSWIYAYGNIQNLATLTGASTDDLVYITYKYYTRSGTSPCTAGSYSSTDYSNILSYSGYNLRDCVDMRRTLSSTNDYIYDIGDDNTKQRVFASNTDFIFWYNMFLPRYDTVYVHKDGYFGVHNGIASRNPEKLPEEKGEMAIYYLYHAPYVYNVKNDISLEYINNQRYTMKEINHLDERITTLENTHALNQLEQSAVNMQITDANGYDRYKSGIFTDAFDSYTNSDINNSEYNASIDATESAVRANFKETQVPFYLNTNKMETQKHGYTLTHKITKTEVYAKNEYASTTFNVQGLMFYVWNGTVELSPAVDTWVEDLGQLTESVYDNSTQKPQYKGWTDTSSKNTTVTEIVWVEGWHVFEGTTQGNTYGKDLKKQLITITTPLGNKKQVWAAQDNHTRTWRNADGTQTGGSWVTVVSTNTKTTTTTANITYNAGYKLTGITYTNMEEQLTFMRQITVTVQCKGLQPYMKFKAYLDTREVTCYVDAALTSPINVIPQNGTFKMYFKVPEKMTVGTKLFRVVEADSGTLMASADYTSHGKKIWVQETKNYLRTWTAKVEYTKSLTSKISSIIAANNNIDPLAESFVIGDIPIYLDSIDVYFSAKDPNMSVTLYIVETENGYPGSTVLAGSQVTLSPSDVATDRYGKYLKGSVIAGNTSCRTIVENTTVENSNWDGNGEFMAVQVTPVNTLKSMKQKVLAPTRFTFPEPLYLEANKEYAFIVATGSYKYELYCSKLGDGDLVTGQAIKEQPYSGCMFRSQNARTWTTEQDCDITFKLNRCVFETGQKTTYFNINYTDKSEFYTDVQNISVNMNCPASTSCSLYYTFSELDNGWLPFENGNDIENDKRYTLVNDQSMRLKMITNTSTNYVSPQIDLEQIYGIFTHNTLKLVKTKENGEVTEEQEYSAETKPASFNNNNTYDSIYQCYHAGTYISNTVKLENASDDLRVILDAYTPNYSSIAVFFQTQNVNLKMIYHNYDCMCGYDSDVDFSNEINKLYYAYSYDKDTNVFTRYDNQCKISGYLSTSNKTAKIYFGELKTDVIDGQTLIFVNADYDLYSNFKGEWSATNYIYGDIVSYKNKLWSANGNVDKISVPSEINESWTMIHAINVTGPIIESDNNNWQRMVLTSDSSNTRNMYGYVEYSYEPMTSIVKSFTDFKIKIEMYSQDEVNMPYVKNLRAIAVI